MSKRQLIKQKLASQAGKFAIVGVLNTLVDIVTVNILTQLFGVQIVIAGLISGTVAMINSFIFYKKGVKGMSGQLNLKTKTVTQQNFLVLV